MEKAKRKHTLPNRLIAFMLTFAMIVSVLTGVLPGSEMTAEAADYDAVQVNPAENWKNNDSTPLKASDLSGFVTGYWYYQV